MTPCSDGQKTLITKENAYRILKAFAKEYKKQHGVYVPTEIVIVGGGSILLNYGFREYTQDFDVLVQSMESIKSVSYRIADMYNLPVDWMNMDFVYTPSFSNKLREVSKHFCSFNNGSIEIRTVNAEYLIAMKMVSAREYRNDISDIIGILIHLKKDSPDFSVERIDEAIEYLYGKKECIIKEEVCSKIKEYTTWSIKKLEDEYSILTQREKEINQELVSVNERYPEVVREDSIDNVIQGLRKRSNPL